MLFLLSCLAHLTPADLCSSPGFVSTVQANNTEIVEYIPGIPGSFRQTLLSVGGTGFVALSYRVEEETGMLHITGGLYGSKDELLVWQLFDGSAVIEAGAVHYKAVSGRFLLPDGVPLDLELKIRVEKKESWCQAEVEGEGIQKE